MKVIITGPTGAIGHALIEYCVEKGDEVLAICHRGSARIQTISGLKNVSVMERNLNELGSLAEEIDSNNQFDVFYHFAWEGTVGADRNNTDLQSNNIRYALDAVKLASAFGCRVFIGAGSQAEYGRVEGVLKPDTPANPENGYGIAKLCAGRLTALLCEQLGIKHIWTRILSIYGPYDGEKSMVISSLRKMIRGEDADFTKGEQKWDYLYSGDAAKALYLLSEKGISPKTYVLGSGEARELRSYIEIMKNLTGTSSKVNLGVIPYGEKQVMHLEADLTELREDTGFEPEVRFEEGIERTIRYLTEGGKHEN